MSDIRKKRLIYLPGEFNHTDGTVSQLGGVIATDDSVAAQRPDDIPPAWDPGAIIADMRHVPLAVGQELVRRWNDCPGLRDEVERLRRTVEELTGAVR